MNIKIRWTFRVIYIIIPSIAIAIATAIGLLKQPTLSIELNGTLYYPSSQILALFILALGMVPSFAYGAIAIRNRGGQNKKEVKISG